MRQRFSREQRQKLLADYHASGLTQSEFARRNDVSRGLLAVWLLRYGGSVSQLPVPRESAEPLPMQEVSLGQILGQPAWAAELVLPSGVTVRLDAQGRAQILAHLTQHHRLC
jgi:transposase-like protein